MNRDELEQRDADAVINEGDFVKVLPASRTHLIMEGEIFRVKEIFFSDGIQIATLESVNGSHGALISVKNLALVSAQDLDAFHAKIGEMKDNDF